MLNDKVRVSAKGFAVNRGHEGWQERKSDLYPTVGYIQIVCSSTGVIHK